MARAQAAGRHLGKHVVGQDILEAVNAELLLAAGRVEESLAHAQASVKLAREEMDGLLGEGLAERVWGQGLARLSRWEEAKIHLNASVQTLLAGGSLLEAARTQVVWGLLCRDHDDRVGAQAHFERALAQFEASGLTREYETVQRYLAHMSPC